MTYLIKACYSNSAIVNIFQGNPKRIASKIKNIDHLIIKSLKLSHLIG